MGIFGSLEKPFKSQLERCKCSGNKMDPFVFRKMRRKPKRLTGSRRISPSGRTTPKEPRLSSISSPKKSRNWRSSNEKGKLTSPCLKKTPKSRTNLKDSTVSAILKQIQLLYSTLNTAPKTHSTSHKPGSYVKSLNSGIFLFKKMHSPYVHPSVWYILQEKSAP